MFTRDDFNEAASKIGQPDAFTVPLSAKIIQEVEAAADQCVQKAAEALLPSVNFNLNSRFKSTTQYVLPRRELVEGKTTHTEGEAANELAAYVAARINSFVEGYISSEDKSKYAWSLTDHAWALAVDRAKQKKLDEGVELVPYTEGGITVSSGTLNLGLTNYMIQKPVPNEPNLALMDVPEGPVN